MRQGERPTLAGLAGFLVRGAGVYNLYGISREPYFQRPPMGSGRCSALQNPHRGVFPRDCHEHESGET